MIAQYDWHDGLNNLIVLELNKTMNKGNYRYDRTDHISRIQANLREMKEEVTEYLKKSNNEAIPPVLRARHYLILSCINTLNNNPNSNSRETIKVIKDLSSEKLGNAADGDRFEPLRESSSEKHEKNKIVKQKRTLLKFQKKNSQEEADCLLPNICQIKLDFEDKTLKAMPRRSILEIKPIEANDEENEYNKAIKERRYHSIDLNRESRLLSNGENQYVNGFRVTNKWLSASKSKDLISTLHKKHSWSDQTYEGQTPAYKEPIIASNQVVDLSKQKINESVSAELSCPNPGAIYQQRKDAIIKRRAEAVMNFAKSRSKNTNLAHKQVNSVKKAFHFDKKKSNPKIVNKNTQLNCELKNECCPWEESDAFPQKSLLTLQGQIF